MERDTIQRHDFSPYTDNGGTVVAIAGPDYSIIASETRLSTGYQIYTREQPKLFQLGPRMMLGSTGCWCDALSFAKAIESRITKYKYDHNRTMSTSACAQLVSTMLYYKRFFPYYISNVVAGLDENGRGALYSYDPVGCFERVPYAAEGTSASLIEPFLDNKVGLQNIKDLYPDPDVKMPAEEAVKLVKDIFVSAGERDIYVGDHVEIKVIKADGIHSHRFDLRKD